jgi:hypothetical protein
MTKARIEEEKPGEQITLVSTLLFVSCAISLIFLAFLAFLACFARIMRSLARLMEYVTIHSRQHRQSLVNPTKASLFVMITIDEKFADRHQ